MDDLNIASITATSYDHNIDNSANNSYCDHAYNTSSNPDSEFVSALNQRAEIYKMV